MAIFGRLTVEWGGEAKPFDYHTRSKIEVLVNNVNLSLVCLIAGSVRVDEYR